MSRSTGGTSTQLASPLQLVKTTIVEVIDVPNQPPERELVRFVEEMCGVRARRLVPDGESLDHIAKAAGLLERMAQQTPPRRSFKKPRGGRR